VVGGAAGVPPRPRATGGQGQRGGLSGRRRRGGVTGGRIPQVKEAGGAVDRLEEDEE
jgi:hypothetical protein